MVGLSLFKTLQVSEKIPLNHFCSLAFKSLVLCSHLFIYRSNDALGSHSVSGGCLREKWMYSYFDRTENLFSSYGLQFDTCTYVLYLCCSTSALYGLAASRRAMSPISVFFG